MIYEIFCTVAIITLTVALAFSVKRTRQLKAEILALKTSRNFWRTWACKSAPIALWAINKLYNGNKKTSKL